MKSWMMLVLTAMLFALPAGAVTQEVGAGVKPNAGLQTAETLCKITGVAMSPLLGTAAVGAYDYWKTPSAKREQLPWYGRPVFWLPALLLVGAVAAKDVAGTALPPGLKKPIDVIETVENKISGVVAAGAFVPLVATFFPTGGGGGTASLVHLGFATVSFGGFLNLLLTPLAMAAFVLVWIACHTINVLILLSPWGVVDAALKSLRTFLMGLVTATSFVSPKAGAVLSIIVIILAYFLAGWSFRMTVFGSVYVWDFFTGKRKRFKPAPNGNWMFTARQIERTPIRTYGKLVKTTDDKLTLEYRPWLFLKSRVLTLPAGTYAVGRGLFYPEIMRVEGEEETTTLVLPPRYRTHEVEVAEAYGLAGVRDVGLLKGFKAIWRGLKSLFGVESRPVAASS